MSDHTETTTLDTTQAGAGLDAGRKVMTLVSEAGEGGGERRIFRLHKRRLVIGSVVSADVRLTGEAVAPIHAVIELDGEPGSPTGTATIFDLASDTGVWVNSRKIVTQALRGGDRIRIGVQEFVFGVDELADLIPRERTRDSGGRKLFLDPEEDLSPLLLEDGSDIDPIFDYRPAEARALEVVMAWRGTILDVEHFVESRRITVGTSRDEHFGIPPLLPRSPYALLTRDSGDFTLNLDPRMKGVMRRNGALQSLDEVREEAARAGADPARIPVLANDFAKISIGEIDFYLSYTAAPPRLRRGRVLDRDPVFLKVFFTSMALTAAAIVAMMNIDVPHPIEADEMPDRVAAILYQPEKFPQHWEKVQDQFQDQAPKKNKPPVESRRKVSPSKPVPKPVPKPVTKTVPRPVPRPTVKLEVHPHLTEPRPVPREMSPTHPAVKPPARLNEAKAAHVAGANTSRSQNEAREGEGARARGVEGTRGSKRAAPGREHQTAAMRPSPGGGKGRGAGNSQIRSEGNVDILKDATGKIEDILGNSAAHLGSGGERLKGFGGFTTQGRGGLALSGSGPGGGGDAESLGGLGKKGRGGGRVGTGLGASGSGSGIAGGMSRVAIRSGGPEEAVVMGSIDSDAVEAALLAHKDEFRACYEKEINAENPHLAGRVGTSFVIGSTGRVTRAGIESTTLHSPSAERCILNVIKRISFPIPRGAGVVQVTYPFRFSRE